MASEHGSNGGSGGGGKSPESAVVPPPVADDSEFYTMTADFMVARDAMFADEETMAGVRRADSGEAGGALFNPVEQPRYRSAPSGDAGPTYRGASAMLVEQPTATGTSNFLSSLMDSTPGFDKVPVTRNMDATDALDKSLYDSIIPPALPPLPYPLERHSYALDGTVQQVRGAVEHAIRQAQIDFNFVASECKWLCVVHNNGKRSEFIARLHKASDNFCLEFQRRRGCSIVFNMAVGTVLANISKAMQAPLQSFVRSEKDMAPAPAAGFYVPSFDIPDVPLDLGFTLDFSGQPPVPVEDSVLAAADKEQAVRSLEEEAVAGVRVLVDMSRSGMSDMAAEGTAGLATLSRAEGVEALLSDACLAEVVATTTNALKSTDMEVRDAGATLLANLAVDQRSHAMLASKDTLPTVIATASAPHKSTTAHVRRECLRALTHLCGGPCQANVKACGGAMCAATVLASCHDGRMQLSAQLIQRALQG